MPTAPDTGADAPHPGRLGYLPELDGLRGMAVLAVVLYHEDPALLRGGWTGVSVFFTLSGYLITRLLLEERAREGRIALGAFYARRALRLLPALVLFLAVYLVVPGGRLEAASAAFFYYANWMQVMGAGARLGTLAHTWSLSVEEQFYLLWPLTLIALLRFAPRRLPVVIGAAAVALAIHRAVLFALTGYGVRFYYGLDMRADALLVGCALAAGVRMPMPSWLALGGIALVMLAGAHTAPAMYTVGLFVEAVCVAAVVADPPRLLALPPLVVLGRLSYGLYLWHFFIMNMVPLGGLRFSLRVLAHLGLAGAIAAASFYMVERPALALKRRLAR